ncbi:MAG TPA: hypothetical protein VH087_09075 [Thermoanaerobaculia bacterium]|jgi:tetratricopeptide (TPR) repeat protein|nr:hypothetical protein [Thermoanaerobaculia bacterium]
MRNVIRALAVIFPALAFYPLCVVPYRANLLLATITQQTLKAQGDDPIAAAPVARANLQDLLAIERPERLNAGWYLLYGTNCELLSRNAEAVEAYSRALAIDQRPEIYVHRGMLLLQLGRVDDAVHDLATAARFNPAVVYDLSGDLRERVAAASRVR